MRRILLLIGAVTAALTLAACSSDSSSVTSRHSATSASTAAGHVDADVNFIQSMIAHHGQAVDMADLALVRANNPEVKALAGRIKAAQGPEIMTMTGWLDSWGRPTTMSSSMPGMDMNPSMPGMMSNDGMTKLHGLSGAAFDREFLMMMIDPHNGAIEMAKAEQSSGRFQPAVQLAGNIVTSQSAEITEMQNLLKAV